MIEHVPPKDFPSYHNLGLAVPGDLAKVIGAAAAKRDFLFADQLLHWAQVGAECERMHAKPAAAPRRRIAK